VLIGCYGDPRVFEDQTNPGLLGDNGEVQRMWTLMVARISAVSPALYATLNPAADSNEIAALERRVGATLPEAFKDYLATANGQNDLGVDLPLHEMHRFLSVQEIASSMDLMDSLFGDEEPLEHITENKVQPAVWEKLWVPFAEFDGSPRLILDLRPGINGVVGQILLWFPGVDLEADDIVIAGDFAEFSAALLGGLTA
jgi:cell wall assembly regulator SMI1